MLLATYESFIKSLSAQLKSENGQRLKNELLNDLPQSLVLDIADISHLLLKKLHQAVQATPLYLEEPKLFDYNRQSFLTNISDRLLENLDQQLKTEKGTLTNEDAFYTGTTSLVKTRKQSLLTKLINSTISNIFGKTLVADNDESTPLVALLNMLGKSKEEVYIAAKKLDPSINYNDFRKNKLPELIKGVITAYFNYDFTFMQNNMTENGQRMLISASKENLKKIRVFNVRNLCVKDITATGCELIDNRPYFVFNGNIVLQLNGKEGYFKALGSPLALKVTPFNVRIEWTKNGPKIAEFRANIMDPDSKF